MTGLMLCLGAFEFNICQAFHHSWTLKVNTDHDQPQVHGSRFPQKLLRIKWRIKCELSTWCWHGVSEWKDATEMRKTELDATTGRPRSRCCWLVLLIRADSVHSCARLKPQPPTGFLWLPMIISMRSGGVRYLVLV